DADLFAGVVQRDERVIERDVVNVRVLGHPVWRHLHGDQIVGAGAVIERGQRVPVVVTSRDETHHRIDPIRESISGRCALMSLAVATSTAYKGESPLRTSTACVSSVAA